MCVNGSKLALAALRRQSTDPKPMSALHPCLVHSMYRWVHPKVDALRKMASVQRLIPRANLSAPHPLTQDFNHSWQR